MPFEVFTKAVAAAKGQATISIQRRGIMSFNQAACALLGEPKAVELLYDRERHRVGLRAAAAQVRHVQRVRTNKKGTTHLVSAFSFTSHYGIPTDVGHRWPAQMEGEVLCIDLDQPPLP